MWYCPAHFCVLKDTEHGIAGGAWCSRGEHWVGWDEALNELLMEQQRAAEAEKLHKWNQNAKGFMETKK